MPYIQRDEAGAIVGLFAGEQKRAGEFKPDDDAEIVAYLAASVPAERVRLPKLTLIDRIDKAGKLDMAIAALGTGKQKIRWDASSAVDPENEDVRALLKAIGCDVEEMLAPETAAEAAI